MFKRLLKHKQIQRRTRWLLWALLAMLIVSFALFFSGTFSAGRASNGTAGVIFGRRVPWETFQQEYRFIRQNLKAQLRQEVSEAFEPFLRQQTWDRLILREEARRRIRASNEELAGFIRKLPTFQQDGRFAEEIYYGYVQALGLSPQAFEDRLRDDLRVQKLAESIKAQVALTDEEARAAYARERQRLLAALIVIRPSDFEDKARQALSESALREYYATHQQTLRRESRRIIEYLGMSRTEASKPETPVTEEQIQVYYEVHQEEFKKEDESIPPLDEIREAVRQRVQDGQIRKRLTNLALDLEEDLELGLRFDEIPLTRKLAIRRVGPIERSALSIPNELTSAMLGAAFDIAIGQVTQVFDTPGGVFMLRPVEESPPFIPPFEEVNSEIERQVIKQRARDAAKERATQLREGLAAKRQDGLTFDEASLVPEVEVLRPEPFTQTDTIESLGAIPVAMQRLFDLKSGELSEVIETPDAFVIGFIEERLPFDEAQFTKEKERFQKELLASKQQQRLSDWLDALRKQARLKSFLDESTRP